MACLALLMNVRSLWRDWGVTYEKAYWTREVLADDRAGAGQGRKAEAEGQDTFIAGEKCATGQAWRSAGQCGEELGPNR